MEGLQRPLAKKIRSAEKERSSSCLLADRVAIAANSSYQRIFHESLRPAYKQTVLAAIILQVPKSYLNSGLFLEETIEPSQTSLLTISLAVGTKVLNGEIIKRDRDQNSFYAPERVRDFHAEVACRRGFMKFLYNVISDQNEAENSLFNTLFYLNPITNLFCFKDGIKVHFYSSSQPCGNASIKKWAKSQNPKFDEQLNIDEFKNKDRRLDNHCKLSITAADEGQVLFLTKRNIFQNYFCQGEEGEEEKRGGGGGRGVFDPVNLNIPVGTAPVDSGMGNVMTCSDKIAKWNVVGIQGSLLSNFFEPIYIDAITVGRKFSQVHCERALCCRLSLLYGNESIHSKVQASGSYGKSSLESCFRFNHPTMLGTKVKFDTGAILTGSEDRQVSEDPHIGANFLESRCMCGWISPSGSSDPQSQISYAVEVLDGLSGYVLNRYNLKAGLEKNTDQRPKGELSIKDLNSSISLPSLDLEARLLSSYIDVRESSTAERISEISSRALFDTFKGLIGSGKWMGQNCSVSLFESAGEDSPTHRLSNSEWQLGYQETKNRFLMSHLFQKIKQDLLNPKKDKLRATIGTWVEKR